MNTKKKFQKYLLKQSMIGLGLANGILTAIVFYFKMRNCFTQYSHIDLVRELAVTSVVIGVSVALIGKLFTKRDLAKGKITLFEEPNWISKMLSDNAVMQVVIITSITFLMSIILGVLTVILQGTMMLQFKVFLIDSIVICTILSAVAAALSIDKTVHR